MFDALGPPISVLGTSDIAVGGRQLPGWEPSAPTDAPMLDGAGSIPLVAASGTCSEGVAGDTARAIAKS